jgi:hypothetical protein
MDATTNALPTALGLGLGFGFIVVVLSVAKLWYAKHRRIQLIHAPPPSRSLPLYHEMSMSLRSSRSTLASRPSVAEFGLFDTPSLGSTTISPSSSSSPMTTPRDLANHGVVVGLLGSPDWEIQLTRGVDKTTRTEAIEYAEDDIMRAVHALPTRSLSRMSSKVSLVNKKTGVSPLLGSESLASLDRECADEVLTSTWLIAQLSFSVIACVPLSSATHLFPSHPFLSTRASHQHITPLPKGSCSPGSLPSRRTHAPAQSGVSPRHDFPSRYGTIAANHACHPCGHNDHRIPHGVDHRRAHYAPLARTLYRTQGDR